MNVFNRLAARAQRAVIMKRRSHYRGLFMPKDDALSISAMAVLTDLKRVCGVMSDSTTMYDGNGKIDPLKMANAQGRREVWLYVMQQLHVPDEIVFKMFETNNDEDMNL